MLGSRCGITKSSPARAPGIRSRILNEVGHESTAIVARSAVDCPSEAKISGADVCVQSRSGNLTTSEETAFVTVLRFDTGMTVPTDELSSAEHD